MNKPDKETYIAEEAFVVENSGELPEVTLHESIYFLTEDSDGPVLKMEAEDILPLKYAVVKRYRAIILRDLDPANRDKGIYRGLERCAANWQRLSKFCVRERIDFQELRDEVVSALKQFMRIELNDVRSGNRSSCVNCSQADIMKLVKSLELSLGEMPDGWQDLCLPE